MIEKTTKAQKSKTHSASSTILTLADLGFDESQRKNSVTGFSLWVRALLQNWRQGTVACKGRADVNRTNKKPWKQKGTGRARAGSARSPLWRGGGVTFGPQPRTRTLSISKKLKKSVLNTLLYNYLDQKKVHLLDWKLEGDVPKTSLAAQALKKANLHDKKVTLFLPVEDMVTFASFANIPTIRILFFDQMNAFDLADSDCWVICNKDVDRFKEMATQWI